MKFRSKKPLFRRNQVFFRQNLWEMTNFSEERLKNVSRFAISVRKLKNLWANDWEYSGQFADDWATSTNCCQFCDFYEQEFTGIWTGVCWLSTTTFKRAGLWPLANNLQPKVDNHRLDLKIMAISFLIKWPNHCACLTSLFGRTVSYGSHCLLACLFYAGASQSKRFRPFMAYIHMPSHLKRPNCPIYGQSD